MNPLEFTLNGQPVRVAGVDPNTTLLQYLRESGLTGTKDGCAEGECGACAVVLLQPDGPQRCRYESVNACLLLVGSLANREIWSVEAVAGNAPGAPRTSKGARRKLHPVQRLLVESGGSQCGYCTPGFVMSLYAEYYRRDRRDPDPESIAGNLCRCTGYRPIRNALRSLPVLTEADRSVDARARRLDQAAPHLRDVAYEHGGRRFFRPTGLDALWPTLEAHPKATLVAGGTDMVVGMNQLHQRHVVIVALDAIEEMQILANDDQELRIGAGVPLATLEQQLGGHVDALDQLWPLFASRLIRRRATLGGNLGNASPIGDAPPVLLALDATIEVASRSGKRSIPIHAFFTSYRETALRTGEVITSVVIPKPFPRSSRFYKVSKRVSDDISTVAGAFAVNRDDEGRVTHARIAFGGVAPTPLRLPNVEAALVGRKLADALADAQRVALQSVRPIDDQRGSARYRTQMVCSLLGKLAHELGADAA